MTDYTKSTIRLVLLQKGLIPSILSIMGSPMLGLVVLLNFIWFTVGFVEFTKAAMFIPTESSSSQDYSPQS